jgi:prepilin-type N-terminal cleavage/methylation domain-containing protein
MKMSSTQHNREKQKGFSMIELLVAFVILAIIAALAVSGISRATSQLQRQSLAQQLKTSLERARFDAVKRRAASDNGLSTVVISPTSFTLNSDTNQNSVLESSEAQVYRFNPDEGGKVVNDLKYPVTVRFNRNGHVQAVDSLGASINPVFTLCLKNCASNTLNADNASVVSVSKTGTVSITPGGANLSFNSNQSWISNSNLNSAIKPTVRVESNYSY